MIDDDVLPEGWAWSTVGEVGEVRLGRQRSPKHQQGKHMRPYLRVANVYEDRIDTRDVLRMNFTPQEFETYRLEPGDLLLNEGQSLEWVGRPAIYNGEVPGSCFQNTLVRWRSSGAVIPKFALLGFRVFLHTGAFQRIARWTTNIAHLGSERFSKMRFPVPPLPEQERIAKATDEQCSKLDAAVDGLERVRRNLKRYRASVLQAAVEGRLVPTEAELARAEGRDYEPASELLKRILTERRRRWEETELARLKSKGKPPMDDRWKAKYKEPIPPGITDLASLPEGWCWATVEQLFAHVTDGDHQPPPQVDAGIPFLVIGDVRYGRIDFQSVRYVSKEYYEGLDPNRTPAFGDLLYSVTGSFGIPVRVGTSGPFCVQRHIAILKPVSSTPVALIHKFMESGFLFSQAAACATGTAQKTVPLKGLRAMVVPVPPVSESQRIIDAVDDAISIGENALELSQANVRRMYRLRQAVLRWAFEGKLVDQDPSDEPASELLERIRKACEAVSSTEKGARRPRRKRA